MLGPGIAGLVNNPMNSYRMNIRGLILFTLSVSVPGGGGAIVFAQDSVSTPLATEMTSSNAQKKFRDMGVLERNAILREIGARDFTSIFQAMLDARSAADTITESGVHRAAVGIR
jgi:hypothetical protein